MLRGCRAVPQAVRRTKVQRANARFLSSGKAAPAALVAARNAKLAAASNAAPSLAKVAGGALRLLSLLSILSPS